MKSLSMFSAKYLELSPVTRTSYRLPPKDGRESPSNDRNTEILLRDRISRLRTLFYPPKVDEFIINVFCEILQMFICDPERAMQTTQSSRSPFDFLRQRLSATGSGLSNLTTLSSKDGQEQPSHPRMAGKKVKQKVVIQATPRALRPPFWSS